MWRTRSSRKGRKPSVLPYWRAAEPCSRRTRSQAAAISARGNTSGAGSPPANEMTSGFSVILSSSRMIELVIRWVRWANRSAQRVARGTSDPAGASASVSTRATGGLPAALHGSQVRHEVADRFVDARLGPGGAVEGRPPRRHVVRAVSPHLAALGDHREDAARGIAPARAPGEQRQIGHGHPQLSGERAVAPRGPPVAGHAVPLVRDLSFGDRLPIGRRLGARRRDEGPEGGGDEPSGEESGGSGITPEQGHHGHTSPVPCRRAYLASSSPLDSWWRESAMMQSTGQTST